MNKLINTIDIDELKNTIQDCNLNFLLGAGMSAPFLKPLGNVEMLLTKLEEQDVSQKIKDIVEASLYQRYFDEVIEKNVDILNSNPTSLDVLKDYKNFFYYLNNIILDRKSTILNKQVNIFTSNIDVFMEKALEETEIEYNDGFCGKFAPVFSLSNFKKSSFRSSLHYDNTFEIPVFNLLKVHGSVTWKTDGKKIMFTNGTAEITDISKKKVNSDGLIETAGKSISDLITAATTTKYRKKATKDFLETYKQLLIVNPTKEKFKETVFNQAYYDLLRIYANELEKENTVLMVMGFSFADEHIRDLTIRVANSNPTLMIYIFAHTSKTGADYLDTIDIKSLKNNNIKIIVPKTKKLAGGKTEDEFEYNLETINQKILKELLDKIQRQQDL